MANNLVRIIGVGNPLMGDDGFGVAVVERLLQKPLPSGVEVVDGGTGGLSLLDLMAGTSRVILVDAVDTGGAPGSVVRLTGGELLLPAPETGFSLHDTGLPAVFALGRELDMLPAELILYGVQPRSLERRLGLSPEVTAAVAEVAGRIVDELTAA